MFPTYIYGHIHAERSFRHSDRALLDAGLGLDGNAITLDGDLRWQLLIVVLAPESVPQKRIPSVALETQHKDDPGLNSRPVAQRP